MTQRWRKLGVIIPQRDAAVWSQRPSAPCVFRTEDRYLMYLHGLQFFSERASSRGSGWRRRRSTTRSTGAW